MVNNNLENQTTALHDNILRVMDRIDEVSRKDTSLPSISDSFCAARSLIESPSYDIVVVGEVKRGKSSLINAIIGCNILPVDNNVATSQVFRISNSSIESYYLVFTDGTKEAIKRNELMRYGSQIDANLYGEPIFKGRKLSYIQINRPIEFLPDGVTLVDTPGLGAIYKSHENITRNYIRNAAAVIFIFDPTRTMVAQEKEFILNILNTTPYMLFVMTKIDLHGEDEWKDLIQRNSELIAPLFKEKGYAPPPILPVSSKLLYNAAVETDIDFREMDFEDSKFEHVKTELMNMIYRTVALLHSGFAIDECEKQTLKVCSYIGDMFRAAAANSKAEVQAAREEKDNAISSLDSLWGTGSANIKQHQEEIAQIGAIVRGRAREVVSHSGAIFTNSLARIEALSSVDEMEQLAKSMPADISNEVAAQWQSICNDAQREVAAIINKAHGEMERIAISKIELNDPSLNMRELTGSENFNCFKNSYMNATLVGGIGTSVLVGLGLFTIPVLAPVVFIGTLLWGLLGGNNDADKNKVNINKANFKNQLVSIMNELTTKLLYIQDSRRSEVDDFVYKLTANANETLKSIIITQREQLVEMKQNIETQASNSQEERRKELAVLEDKKENWKDIAKTVIEIKNQRLKLENATSIVPKS